MKTTINAWIETAEALSVTIDFKPYSIPSDAPEYDAVLQAIDANDADLVLKLVNRASVVESFSNGNVTVRNGEVFYMNEPLHNSIVDKILELMKANRKFGHLLNFLERLMENPSKRAVDELYKFLEHKNLPITSDGCFLAYKAVRHDYSDKYTGKFDNTPGKTLEMPRNKVDDNKENGCSYGFHAGSIDYVSRFANSYGDKKIVVKIDPAFVVSVPLDCNCQKLRTCKYEVLSDFNGVLTEPVYNSRGESFEDEEFNEDAVFEFLSETLDNQESVKLNVIRNKFEKFGLTYNDIVEIVDNNGEGFIVDDDADHKGDWTVSYNVIMQDEKDDEGYPENEIINFLERILVKNKSVTVRGIWNALGSPQDLEYDTIIDIVSENPEYKVSYSKFNRGDYLVSKILNA